MLSCSLLPITPSQPVPSVSENIILYGFSCQFIGSVWIDISKNLTKIYIKKKNKSKYSKLPESWNTLVNGNINSSHRSQTFPKFNKYLLLNLK